MALRAAGHVVVAVEDGTDALRQIEQAVPALVVLDLALPRLGGHDVYRELKARPDTRDIPIVVVTAMELTPEERLRLNGAVEQVLQKGAYSREELLQQVRDLVVALCVRPLEVEQQVESPT